MAKKEIIIDGTTYALGAEAQNVDYTNASMQSVANAKQALDNLDNRLGAIEHPNTDIIYTEADATIVGSGIYSNGGETPNGVYNCSDFIPIPVGAKMFIKMNYSYPSNYGLVFFYHYNIGSYSCLNGKSLVSIGPYDDFTEFTVPDRAVAFRFTHRNTNTSNRISIKFVLDERKEPPVKLRVASWNIGHFSLGHGAESRIDNENVDAMRSAYRQVFDKFNADIICFSEFDPVFNIDTTSSPINEILSNYPYYKVGGKATFDCNAVFSRFPIVGTQETRYTNRSQNRYIKETTININGKHVKVIATHHDFDSNYISQLEELIALYANEPYVIIGADFNIHIDDTWGEYVSGDGTDGYLNYKYLTEAGYTLLRYDYLDNTMLVNPLSTSAADNIAVKGFAMGNRKFVYEQGVSETLSDHCMVACELVML